jgi:hypothetical protein
MQAQARAAAGALHRAQKMKTQSTEATSRVCRETRALEHELEFQQELAYRGGFNHGHKDPSTPGSQKLNSSAHWSHTILGNRRSRTIA